MGMNLWRPVPADPHDWFSAEEIERARRYNRGRQRIAAANAAAALVSVIAVIASRVIVRIEDAGLTNWPVVAALAVLITMLALAAATLPMDVASYRHERRWGFTDQPVADWVREHVKGSVVGLILAVVLLLPFWAVVRVTDAWWFYGWAVFFSFAVLLAAITPSVLMPIFNTFTPVDDPAMHERIKRLSREAGVPVANVFTMDASRQTRKDNAFFAGFGRGRRVVVYDNLLKQSPRDVDVVIAHEIAHLRRRHLSRGIALSALVSLAIFALLGWASRSRTVLDLLGVRRFDDPASLPFVLLVLTLASAVTNVVTSWQARAFERQADVDSLEFTRDAKTFMDAHRGLALRNLGELDPSWWHRVQSTHPPAAERLALGTRWQAQRIVTVLFTDIVGSTELIERIGDAAWYEVRRDHDEIVRARVKEHRGTEVDSAGDGFLLVFDDAGEALLCAIAVQRDIAERTDLNVRMGLHTGEVVRKDNAVFGRDVHVAARVSALAEGGQILVTGAVADALQTAGRFVFGPGREVELKGLSGTQRVHVAEVLTLT